MVEPSKKDEQLEQAMKGTFGFDRRDAIRRNKCVPIPYGCGGDAEEFRNAISRKEYTISGLCQKCQDKVFGADE